jgi:hypothetical protein
MTELKAKSYFLFDIVEVQVKRFLNAERLKAEAVSVNKVSAVKLR